MISDPIGKQVAEFMSAGSAIGRALIAPGGVPAARIAALRNAFDQLVKDPDFLRQVAEMGVELDPKSGLETQAISNAILAASPDVIKGAIEISK